MHTKQFTPPTVIDLFSGCGGLSLGFQQAGYPVIAGFDAWPAAVAAYNRNLDHPGHLLDLSDVETTAATLAPHMDYAQMIIGGPPCQDFSSAGKRTEADRADLTEKFASIVTRFSPELFVMENVPRAQHATVFRNAVNTLKQHGYGITEIVLNAAHCGVPQARKRLFTIGALNAPDGLFRHHLEINQSETPRTMREHFGDTLGLEAYYRHPRSYSRRAVYSIDEPAATIRGVNRPVAPGYQTHPGDKAPLTPDLRALTTKERAQVQTFPDWYDFGTVKTHAEQMIGNAVPVQLAQYVGENIWSTYKSWKSHPSA